VLYHLTGLRKMVSADYISKLRTIDLMWQIEFFAYKGILIGDVTNDRLYTAEP
jgi:hypothetical protein